MSGSSQGKSFHCWVGMHKWVTRADAGARWQECGRCGRYRKSGVAANRHQPGGSGDSGMFGAGGGFP